MSQYEGDVFSKLVGVPANEATKAYIAEVNKEYSLRVSEDFVTKYGNIDSYTNKDVQFVSDSVVEEIKLNMEFTLATEEDRILRRVTIPSLREASVTEQRWLQAEPTLNNLIQLGVCDGFKETVNTLTDMDLNPTDRRDYKLMTSGVCGISFEDDSCGIYTDSLITDKDQLNMGEKRNIMASWNALRLAIEDNVDITDEDASFL